METKQFPEKWAVRGSQEFAEFLKRCDKINNSKVLDGDVATNYYLIRGNALCFDYSNHITNGYTEVTLEDLIAHYEPKPKWMPLTRGGYEYKIYEEVGELLFGSLKMINGTYMPTTWKLNGRWGSQEYDLIPYNPRIAELEEKIESKRSELAELEGELKELKK